MTRLLLLLPFLAGVLAAGMNDSKSDGKGSDSMGSGSMGPYNMPSNDMGSKGSGSKDMMSGNSGTNINVNVDINVDIILVDSNMGGSSKSSYMAPPPMAPGKTWNVTVGGSAGLVYTPSTIEAAVGDIVVFTFLAKNHTLTQSTFPLPCVKMGGGMDSGFMPNPEGTLYPAPSFSFQVNVTTPLWFYCRQTGHCGMGMVFSINPTVAKSQSDFLAEAIAQNGTKSTMSMTTAPPPAMTTMYTAAPPAMSPPPPMSAPPAAPPPAAAPPAAAPPAAAPPAAAPPVSSPPASGSNTVGGDTSGSGDSCSCSCFCGVADFPPMAGMYNYGGMGGAMPAMPASAPPAAPAAPPPSAGAPLGGAGG